MTRYHILFTFDRVALVREAIPSLIVVTALLCLAIAFAWKAKKFERILTLVAVMSAISFLICISFGLGGGRVPDTGLDGFLPLSATFLVLFAAIPRKKWPISIKWSTFSIGAVLSTLVSDISAGLYLTGPGLLVIPGAGGWNDALAVGLATLCVAKAGLDWAHGCAIQ